jgi:DNA-binding CsgD family transcriptional regulator
MDERSETDRSRLRCSRDSLARRLAVSKVQELRRAGVSYRDIGRWFSPPHACERAARLSCDRGIDTAAADTSPARQYPDARPFLRALDAVDQTLGFFDAAGALIYGNRPLREQLAAEGGERLCTELHLFVEHSWSLVRCRGVESAEHVVEDLTIQEVPLPAGHTSEGSRIRLKGSYVGLDLFGSGGSVLVSLERSAPQPLEDGTLRARFGLTRSECRVLRLVVEGKSNTQIARTLFISPHTVRTHVGVILSKLGVRSRAAATARVLSGLVPGELCDAAERVQRRERDVE